MPEWILDHEVRHFQHRLARLGRRLVHAQIHLAADHQLGELLGRRLGRGQRRDDGALAHHGDDVGDVADLAQLVRDEHHALALAPQGPQDAKEVVGLLGCEDGGRLVEDQEVGAPEERLQDLHALALAHAEIGDARVGVDLEVVLPAQALELGAGACQSRPEPEAPLGAEDDVFQDRERLHQHEVLMHHADPERQGVVGAADRRRPASHQDLAAVGAVIAVQDAHQRRLAGAVLAHEAVDRPLANDQRQVAVGVDFAEPLVDAPQLDDRRRSLGAHFAM
jgi:hypothetical protein